MNSLITLMSVLCVAVAAYQLGAVTRDDAADDLRDSCACGEPSRELVEQMHTDLETAVRQRAELVDAVSAHIEWLVEQSGQHAAHERHGERAATLRRITVLRQHLKTAGASA